MLGLFLLAIGGALASLVDGAGLRGETMLGLGAVGLGAGLILATLGAQWACTLRRRTGTYNRVLARITVPVFLVLSVLIFFTSPSDALGVGLPTLIFAVALAAAVYTSGPREDL